MVRWWWRMPQIVELDRYNGRTTLCVIDPDGVPLVAWLRAGHASGPDEWCYWAVTPAEAQQFIDNPPMILPEWGFGRRSHTRIGRGPEARPQMLQQIVTLLGM